jgi:deoxycytidylate deaminase
MKPRFLQLAKKLSDKSAHKYRLGSVIVKGNKILGVGYNQTKTHTKADNEFHTLHAELKAIINAQTRNLYNTDIYVYRQLKDGSPALSYPCKNCINAIKSLGIKNIYYTTNGGYAKKRVSEL